MTQETVPKTVPETVPKTVPREKTPRIREKNGEEKLG